MMEQTRQADKMTEGIQRYAPIFVDYQGGQKTKGSPESPPPPKSNQSKAANTKYKIQLN